MKKIISVAIVGLLVLGICGCVGQNVDSGGKEVKCNTNTEDVLSNCDFFYSFREGLAMVRKDDGENCKYGFIDKSGNVVVPIVYDDAVFFSEGLARVEKNGKWWFIDKDGKIVIPIGYYYAWSFSEGLAEVRKDGKYGFIDKRGKVVVPIDYDLVMSFNEGLAMVKRKTNMAS